MKVVFSEKNKYLKDRILGLVSNFKEEGETLFDGKRNEIKIFNYGETRVNIKAFRVPNVINIVAYSFFRKSKAERSFEYARMLLFKGILTPTPIAFVEEKDNYLIGRSFYISEHLEYDFTFREVDLEQGFPNRESLLKAFSRFTFNLHELNVKFLDHSPGNTLIKLVEGVPQFYLVDLNRMEFKELSFEERMKNFARLTKDEEVVRIMAGEYAQLIGKPKAEVFEKMLFYNKQFWDQRIRKRKLKNKFKSLIGQ